MGGIQENGSRRIYVLLSEKKDQGYISNPWEKKRQRRVSGLKVIALSAERGSAGKESLVHKALRFCLSLDPFGNYSEKGEHSRAAWWVWGHTLIFLRAECSLFMGDLGTVLHLQIPFPHPGMENHCIVLWAQILSPLEFICISG